jgi:integrase
LRGLPIATNLTEASIRALKPRKLPYKVTAPGHRSEGRLVIKVLPSGLKEFYYRYRKGGVDKTVRIGRYQQTPGDGGMSYQQARERLADLIELLVKHGDVKAHLEAEEEAEKQETRQRELEARRGSFGQLLDAYVAAMKAGGRTSAHSVSLMFGGHVKKPFQALCELKAAEIQSSDIQKILARLIKRGITRQVNKLRSHLHAAFQHGAKADHDPRRLATEGVLFGVSTNPVGVVPRIAEYERAGERNLGERELKRFWDALERQPIAVRTFLRFNLALGGQRTTQLLRATRKDFDVEKRTVLLRDPKGRTGTARDHLLPITGFAYQQLAPMLEISSEAPGPFSSDGKRPLNLSTVSKAVRDISDALTKVDIKKKRTHPIGSFQLRDLRRTCETMLASIGVDRETRAQLLSHGRATGIQSKHYDRYHYFPEKARALERWTRHLERITLGMQDEKVVALRGGKR